jgi:hypothetical protein
MLNIDPEEFDELYRLYCRANTEIGVSLQEAKKLNQKLRERLQRLWNASGRPMPHNFDDFRRMMVDQFRVRLRRDNPRRS